ncbi:hypothetical protein [Sphingobium sp. SCG-1]|uniref:hypothetical protein n=1 Tax=Sphingobium sp. SCG-1 TaxID=2072936 RepID=UPI001670437E|nr:hypothetical protein [Sphingobium sp. SCG-1]
MTIEGGDPPFIVVLLRPKIPHGSSVEMKIIKGVEPVEVIDRKVGNGLKFGKPHVYRHAPAPILFQP